MGSTLRASKRGDVIIDFGSASPTPKLTFEDRLGHGGVTLTRGAFRPTEGMHVRSAQITVAIHESTPFRMDWRTAESDRLWSAEIAPGQIHIGDGRLPFWVRSHASPTFFALAMDERFVRTIWEQGFEGAGDFVIRTEIGAEDPVIDHLGLVAHAELENGGAGGRLYAESLGTTLALHLLRHYGSSTRIVREHRGGLASRQLRRVIEYVNEHLDEDLSLVELSEVTGLSPHHFGDAFKAATGKSPHRYVTERRLSRARELLRETDRSISDIGYAVGFSSQSHFTANFRPVVGFTPNRFRRLVQ